MKSTEELFISKNSTGEVPQGQVEVSGNEMHRRVASQLQRVFHLAKEG